VLNQAVLFDWEADFTGIRNRSLCLVYLNVLHLYIRVLMKDVDVEALSASVIFFDSKLINWPSAMSVPLLIY